MQRLFRRALTLATGAGLLVVGAQLTGIVPASAHYNTVSGVAACQSDGTYTVTWTVANEYTAENETATETALTPGGTLAPTSLDLAADGSAGSTGTMIQSGIAGNATAASLTINGVWHPDNFTESAIGSLSLPGTCAPSKPTGTATAPSSANGACVHNAIVPATVTIPNVKGISYTLDSKPISAGKHEVAAGKHVITASSTTLTLTGTTTWTITVSVAPATCGKTVLPATPNITETVCHGGSPTAPTLAVVKTPHVTYQVSKQAPYRAGESVRVTATVTGGYVLGTLPSAWTRNSATSASRTITFSPAPSACSGAAGKHSAKHPHPHHTSTTPSGIVPVAATPPAGALAQTGTRTENELALAGALLLLGTLCLVGARRRPNQR